MSVETKEDLKALWGDFATASLALVEKWAPFYSKVRVELGLPPEVNEPSYYARLAATMCETQAHYFASRTRNLLEPEHEPTAEFVDGFFRALVKVVLQSATTNIFSWQPMQQAVGGVAFLKVASDTDDVVTAAGLLDATPEFRLELKVEPVDIDAMLDEDAARVQIAEVASQNSGLVDMNTLDDMNALHGKGVWQDVLFCAVEELYADFERQAVRLAMETEEDVEYIDIGTEAEGLLGLVSRSYQIHRLSLRGPANVLVMGPELFVQIKDWKSFSKRRVNVEPVVAPHRLHHVGVVDGRFHVYMDPMLMGRRLLMARAGTSLIDTGLVVAPFVISGDGGKFRLRGAIKKVNPSFFLVLEC